MELGKIGWKIATGFTVAALIALVPPLLFLNLPGMLIFLLYAPIWGYATAIAVALSFLLTGQLYRTSGAVIFVVFLFAFPPMHRFAATNAEVVSKLAIQGSNRAQLADMVDKKCAERGGPEWKPARAKPGLLILDGFSRWNYGRGYDPLQLAAALGGVDVVEIEREIRGLNARSIEGRSKEAKPEIKSIRSIRAERTGDCTGAGNTTALSFINKGRGPTREAVNTNLCFKERTLAHDPLQDSSPAILLRHGRGAGPFSEVIDVFERDSDGETLLGTACYNEYKNTMYPELRGAERESGGAWFRAMLGKALGSDLGETAVKKILAEN